MTRTEELYFELTQILLKDKAIKERVNSMFGEKIKELGILNDTAIPCALALLGIDVKSPTNIKELATWLGCTRARIYQLQKSFIRRLKLCTQITKKDNHG